MSSLQDILDNGIVELASMNALLVKLPGNVKLQQKIAALELQNTSLQSRLASSAALATNNTLRADQKTELASFLGENFSNSVYNSVICDGNPGCTTCLYCQVEAYKTAGLSAEEIRLLL